MLYSFSHDFSRSDTAVDCQLRRLMDPSDVQVDPAQAPAVSVAAVSVRKFDSLETVLAHLEDPMSCNRFFAIAHKESLNELIDTRPAIEYMQARVDIRVQLAGERNCVFATVPRFADLPTMRRELQRQLHLNSSDFRMVYSAAELPLDSGSVQNALRSGTLVKIMGASRSTFACSWESFQQHAPLGLAFVHCLGWFKHEEARPAVKSEDIPVSHSDLNMEHAPDDEDSRVFEDAAGISRT